MSFVAISPVLAWFIAGIVFFVIELLLPGLILFFFGLGAWCAALAVYLLPMALSSQLLVFLATSLLSLLLLRAALKKIFLGRVLEVDAMETRLPDDALGLVIEDILPPAEGKVKFAGSFWQASAEQALVRGTIVRIVEKKNLTLKVSPVDREGEA